MSIGDVAVRIVNAIIDDLSDRKGLKNTWWNIDEDIKDEIHNKWRTIVVNKIQKESNANPAQLPQARNLNMLFIGRGVFSIDGVPGLFMQKKPVPLGDNGEPVRARKCVGKGNAVGTFYRIPDLEYRLLAAIQGEAEWKR